ncbi:MAG TPA: hypothetical protein VEQ10_04375, partial [Vicinamibacteria bacterium]|nr:hypothetical protein [Vicinamibacteria bacterium]
KRLALAAFVGDGYTTTALGREDRAAEDVALLRPHKSVVSEAWLAAACDDALQRRPAWFERWRAHRRLQQALGGRLRWAEAQTGLSGGMARALVGAGVALHVASAGPGGPGPGEAVRH